MVYYLYNAVGDLDHPVSIRGSGQLSRHIHRDCDAPQVGRFVDEHCSPENEELLGADMPPNRTGRAEGITRSVERRQAGDERLMNAAGVITDMVSLM